MPKQDLINYVDNVNRLIQDHDKQTQELSDIRVLTDIVNETWQQKLDRLADLILEQPIDGDRTYCKGLIKAYNIMKGAI